MQIQQGYLATHTGDRIVTHTGDAFLLPYIVADRLDISADASALITIQQKQLGFQEGFLIDHQYNFIVTHSGARIALPTVFKNEPINLDIGISIALNLVAEFSAVLVVNAGASMTLEDDPIVDIGRLAQFKSVRSFSSNSALLTWLQQGLNVDRVDVYRSVGQRGLLTKVGESTTSSYTDNGLTDTDTVSYQVVPINLRIGAKKGKASYIVYNAGSDKIL